MLRNERHDALLHLLLLEFPRQVTACLVSVHRPASLSNQLDLLVTWSLVQPPLAFARSILLSIGAKEVIATSERGDLAMRAAQQFHAALPC